MASREMGSDIPPQDSDARLEKQTPQEMSNQAGSYLNPGKGNTLITGRQLVDVFLGAGNGRKEGRLRLRGSS